MKAVILAAGIASRLRPLTTNRPKCMVRVCNKPLLEYQLDAYRRANVKDIYIVAGYEAQAIRDYCNRIADLNIHVIESVDYKTTNNMYSLYLTRDYVKNEAFILNNADLIIDGNMVNMMVQDTHPDLIMVDTSQYNDESMKIRVNENGDIIDISKKISEQDAYGCSIDYYKFSSRTSKILFDTIEDIIENQKNRNQWTEVALQLLLQNQAIKMQPINTNRLPWVEIDNYADLSIADALFSDIDANLKNIELLFLDLDGTVYLGNTIIDGSREFIEKMKKAGKSIYFLSNNSSKDKKQYVEKLKMFNIEAKEDNIILSTDGLVHYLNEKGIKSVYVVGTEALVAMIENSGISVSDVNPEYVIVGYDTELTYEKLAKAGLFINRGIEVLATHCDMVCPTPEGAIPDAGSMLKLLEAATGKTPKEIFGKPHASMIYHILEKNGIQPKHAAMIGDRMYTDMKLAENAGIKSILVLSGETTRDDVQEADIHIDLIVPSLRALLPPTLSV
ncbi:hypothetical protein AGMMS49928_00200 [Spirochaetia bacterium]|nr:hypothetical protein AGMMS49928_00200 [Spirochaetia bacterium]